ncbi:MAG: response regulator [Acidobacteriaceae bacterium]|nr:response regulator [Acidobacteriaceae bacterium]
MEKRAAAFARLFQSAEDGVYIGTIGPDDTSTVAANPSLKRILGYDDIAADTEVRPFDVDRFVDPKTRHALLERLVADGRVSNYLLRLRRVDGGFVWVELTGHAKANPKTGRLQVEGLLRDVSERKKLDDQSKEIYHQLLQAEKMAALGQTISGVAHELNNPLATILNWAERLTQKPALDPSVRRGCEIILGEAERAARTVRHLLTSARKRQTTRAMVDVNQVIRETLALRAYEQRGANISIVDALAATLPKIFADGHQVKQILLNLMINAEQAMLAAHGHGTLVLRTWHDTDRNNVTLEITDDGPGIPEQAQPKIFDPFFTTKEVGQGTGLGLTVVYAIVQEHGGQIRFESRPEKGTSFFVEFPVLGARAAMPATQSKTTADATKRAAILLVEDEAPLAAAVMDTLRDEGYTVDYAGDGEQALALVRRRSFDLVICDLKMPRLDGRAFFRTVSVEIPTLARRILFVTGDVAGTDAETFLEKSGCRWLAEPFRLAELLRAVREQLRA